MKAPSSDTSAPAIPHNPGKTLRHARETQGLNLSGVSAQLNLPERSLVHIEAGDFSQLPGHTFARGYVRSYAKLLGLDQTQIVQEFDRYTGTNAKGSQVHGLGHIEEPVRLSSIGLRLLSLLLLVVLSGLVFFWWQDSNMGARVNQLVSAPGHVEVEGADGSIQIHPLDDAEEPVIPATTLANHSASSVVPLPLAGKSSPAQTQPLVPSVGETATAASNNSPTKPAAPETQDVEAAPVLPTGQGRLELHFTANCWTRVIDGDGRILLNTLMKSGSSQSLQGKEPLNVRFGYAKAAQLIYNGTTIDLAPHTKGSVARIQLGQ